jgi:hypothetical protein
VWKIGPEWVAQQKKLVSIRTMNCGERICACGRPTCGPWIFVVGGLAACHVPAGGGSGMSPGSSHGDGMAMICSEVRQS